MGLLDGKCAIVTGAVSGIGRAISETFVHEGARVVGVDSSADAHPHESNDNSSTGRSFDLVQADVGDPGSGQECVRFALDSMDRLDILVNCAGIMRTARVIDLKLEDWLAVYRVNVEGTFLFCQAAARSMIEQDQGGCIVNISSAAALKADPKHAAYSSSKAAVLALTRVLALELGENRIRVNAILPGATKTPMLDRVFNEVQGIESELLARTLLGRIGTTQDQANAALFLASDLASHITGEYLVVSGGEFLNP